MDVLTYITIKSYYNYDKKNCFPAIDTIAERMGASRSLVIDSTTRLVKAGFIRKTKRFKESNLYSFKGFDTVDKIPVEVLDLDLSVYEKAMLILLRQCCEGTRINVHGNITQIANKLGLTYKTVYTQLSALIDKGYVEELPKNRRYGNQVYILSRLIDWSYDTDAGDGYPVNSTKYEDIRIIIG